MHSQLLDLPTELIDLIIEHVYFDGCQLVRALLPLSVTCKALRAAAKPHLFASLTIESDGYYLNTERTPHRLRDGKALSLPHIIPNILDSVSTLSFVSWHRLLYSHYKTDTWKFPEDMAMIGAMSRLRTIIFDPPHAHTRATLRTLAPVNLLVSLEYRNHDSPGAVAILDPAEIGKNIWAITCATGHQGAIDVARQICSRLRALQWAYPTNHTTRENHVKLLEHLQSATLIDELHVSERIMDLNETYARKGSYARQICGLISRLTLLRRCRIEGSTLTNEFLKILPDLTLLQDLSIYSVFRRVFHPACDLEDAERAEPESTVEMPWLKLPNVRKLDLRYICKHFTIKQIVPKGLTALRIEFFGRDERINLEDLDWLVQHCPGLERLELDMGSLVDFKSQTELPKGSPETSSQMLGMFKKLREFRCLHTLRLFPTYWHREKLLSNPFADENGVALAVKVFSQLRLECSNLRVLIICISFGEYPFDIVPRMSLSIRPVKYVLRAIGAGDDVLVQWGYGAADEMYEVTYQGDTALPESKTYPVPPKTFFDDLSDDWIIPHYELDR